MALKSTIFKANVQIADIDHGYYADHSLTLARHPSETSERMMMRLLALAMNAWQIQDLCQGDATMGFGAGLSDPDDPDVWLTDFTGRKRLWIEVGQPDEKPLVRACAKADRVLVYAYSHAADVWWRALASKVSRLERLEVWRVPADALAGLEALADRSMMLQATLHDNTLTLGNNERSVTLEPQRWQ
jgi:uncharacterized protein YaeQ